MGYESPTPQELLINSICFWLPACLFFIGRLANGRLILNRLQIDDFLMCFVFFIYSSLIILINVSAKFATNLYPPQDESAIMADPVDVSNRITGSIIVVPMEQCMLISTWGVKACVLIFLRRMTYQMPRNRLALNAIAGFTAVGFVVIEICYYGVVCRPFEQYWAMPVQNPDCATYGTYSRIQMSFNISSDVLIIVLPLFILSKSGLPIKRKILLCGLFSLGIFTIICAILNKYYNFMSPDTTTYALWYIREASVAMWVGNLICCWQLLQRVFKLRSFDGSTSDIKHKFLQRPTACDNSNDSIGGHSSGWYSRLMASIRGDTIDEATISNGQGSSLESGGLDSRGVESFDPLQTQTGTLMTVARDGDDAGPALAYRDAHEIV